MHRLPATTRHYRSLSKASDLALSNVRRLPATHRASFASWSSRGIVLAKPESTASPIGLNASGRMWACSRLKR